MITEDWETALSTIVLTSLSVLYTDVVTYGCGPPEFLRLPCVGSRGFRGYVGGGREGL